MSNQVRWRLFAVGGMGSLILAGTLVMALPRRSAPAKEAARIAEIPKPVNTPVVAQPASFVSRMRQVPPVPQPAAPKLANKLPDRTNVLQG